MSHDTVTSKGVAAATEAGPLAVRLPELEPGTSAVTEVKLSKVASDPSQFWISTR
jgi:hypothetical protein